MPRTRRRPLLALTAALMAAVALAGCSAAAAPGAQGPALPACATPNGAALAPPAGTLFGVNLDWGAATLEDYAAALGRRPSVAVSFSDMPLDDTDVENVAAAGAQVRTNGGLLLLTLEPHDGLAAVTPDATSRLVALLASVNRTGVPVLVRFGHEMNGSWYPWGQQPAAYVAAFRSLADAVHAGAPGSAMMWAPNYGGGYPFTGGRHAAAPGSRDAAVLDSDGDGALTAADDPYAPYYPGDDVVDWVGMSLYHWGSAYPWGENEVPEDGKFAAQLTGTYVGLAGDETAVPDFYGVYGTEHGKPVAIPETAALVVPGPGVAPADALAIRRAWWGQVFSPTTAEDFPLVRMVNWFEWDKHEPEVAGDVHWGVLGDETTRAAFRADLPTWLVFASEPAACAVPDAGDGTDVG